MKAIVHDVFGPPDVLQLKDIDQPVVTGDDVLVRVHATSVNPADWHFMRGTPYVGRMAFGLFKPKDKVRGLDVAGQVAAVGKNVTEFHPGDEVFGVGDGAFAEYVLAKEKNLVAKPKALTFEQAAAVPVAAVTALQGLRDHGQVQAGQRVLINGASGGVGTFAVQIAKAFGADVTAVCSTSNLEMARSLGADKVIDYTHEDFTLGEQRCDLMLDIAGSRPWSEIKRVLGAKASLVVAGGPNTNRWIGPLSHFAKVRLASVGESRNVVLFLATVNKKDLLVLQDLLEAGKVTPVIDRTYPLSETAEAVRYQEEGHARGKVVITI